MVTVGAEHAGKRPIVQVQLDRPSVSPVRPVFTLVAAKSDTVMGSRGPVEGTGPAHLAANFLVPGPGTYDVIVRDADGDAADPRHPYTVLANVFDDPDQGEADDAPAVARPATRGIAITGAIASSGDRDFISFSMPYAGLSHLVLDQAAASGALRLHVRLLRRSVQAPDDLGVTIPISEYEATRAGDALHVDVVRQLAAADYLLEITDSAGTNADERPAAQWTATLSDATEPDAQEQGGHRNDTAATGTVLGASGTTQLEGVIGSEGDRDWFHLALPATTTARIVEIAIDPLEANDDVQLLWAVGTKLAQPAGACDASCGPTLFCSAGHCGYTLHALRDYATGDATSQVVRLRQQGAAQEIDVLVQDQGDDERTAHPYSLRVTVLPDPDANEPDISNDTIATATPVASSPDGLSFAGAGQISWWDFVDGRGTFQEPADRDWFALSLPPRTPCTPGAVDGGVDPCPATDGGPSYLPRPDFGVVMRWHGPTDNRYQLGLQGAVDIGDARTACLFSFDQRTAHADGAGGFSIGDNPGDPCFCLPASASDRMWVRIDGPHRPDPPAANAYSDLPYGFELTLTPGALQTACQGVCPVMDRASSCP